MKSTLCRINLQFLLKQKRHKLPMSKTGLPVCNPMCRQPSPFFFRNLLCQARCQQILKEGETHVVLLNMKQRETSNSQSEKDQRGECIRCSPYTHIQLTAESSIKDHVIRKLLCACACVCMWCAFVVYTDIVDPEFQLLCMYRVHPCNSMLYKKS